MDGEKDGGPFASTELKDVTGYRLHFQDFLNYLHTSLFLCINISKMISTFVEGFL